MPRRQILSESEREGLLSVPVSRDELIRLYSFSEHDLSVIGQHRGADKRLGFAILLCYMRYPGIILPEGDRPNPSLLKYVSAQLHVAADEWEGYADLALDNKMLKDVLGKKF